MYSRQQSDCVEKIEDRPIEFHHNIQRRISRHASESLRLERPMIGGCCHGYSPTEPPIEVSRQPAKATKCQEHPARLVQIPGGKIAVGTDKPELPLDGEGPVRFRRVPPFLIDPFAVTNAWFAEFVDATAYVTDAEQFGWSSVFHLFVPDTGRQYPLPPDLTWWYRVDGANWFAPEGPGSTVDERGDHPVVHVSRTDAEHFEIWAGGRLPSEAEWEQTARGGFNGARFPWGEDEPSDHGPYHCNIWQGNFPDQNLALDGYVGTAPVHRYDANGFGIYNMCGNVWELCADPFRVRSLKRGASARNADARSQGLFIAKGGSYLCHKSYCYRYRIAARTGVDRVSTTGHIGFRLVFD